MKIKNKIFNLKIKDENSLNPNDCKWYTFKAGEVVPKELVPIAKVQGALFDEEEKEEELISLDLNGDGIVDEKDASIAGKVLSASRKPRKSKKRKGDD